MSFSKDLIHNPLLSWETQEDNISCSYKEEPIDSKIRFLHCHDGYEVLMMKRGNVDMQIEDRMITLQPGDIVLIPPYVFHFARQQSTDTYCRVVLNMKEALIQSLIASNESYRHITDVFYQTPDYHIHVNGSTLRQLIDLACALEATSGSKADAYGATILSKSLLSIILVILNRQAAASSVAPILPQTQAPSMPKVVTDVIHYVDQNLAGDLSVSGIAESVHLNSVYLTRRFRQYSGLSLQQYIIEKRLAEAKRMLRNGQSPTEVCYACGFNNYSNFSRTFTNHVKISPRQYQENSRAQFTPVRG
ncbi:MAG: AraC family transcriptional regulator [Lachnospiraceae bacterium]|nr:AraC family transcriptional regulator [Lachnospiraceae bacterium]